MSLYNGETGVGFRLRGSDQNNVTRWYDDIKEYHNKPEYEQKDIGEFTCGNIKWHGFKYKNEIVKGEPWEDCYYIIGQDQSVPDRWYYLHASGSTYDSDITKDFISTLEVHDSANW